MIGTRRPIAIAVTVAVGTAALALGCGGSLTKPDAGTAGIGGAPIMTGGAGASGAAGAGFAGADAAVDSRLDSYPITNCGGTRGVTATTGSCTYVLAEPAPAGDIARVFVFVNGLQVPMDPTRTNGWDYNDASMSAFTLYGQACADAMSDGGYVDITIACLVP